MHPNQGWQQQPQGHGPQQGPGAPQPGYGPPPGHGGPGPGAPGYGQPQGYGAPQQPGYGPPQGGPGYGPGPQGYGPHGWAPRPPSPVAAFLVGGLWTLVSIMCFVFAILNSEDGKGVRQTPEVAVALIGLAFGRSIVGNGDAAIAATYVTAGVVLLLAGLLFARLGFARWILAPLGFLITAYYIFVVIRLAINEVPFEFMIGPIVALLLWLIASVVSILPPVGKAMRGYRPRH